MTPHEIRTHVYTRFEGDDYYRLVKGEAELCRFLSRACIIHRHPGHAGCPDRCEVIHPDGSVSSLAATPEREPPPATP